MFRFTMINHLCNDMQTLMDTTRPTDRIRQDVARSPGRRQPRVPQQLRRLPQRHGSDGAGVRLLQLQRHRRTRWHQHRHHAVHLRAGAAEVPHQLGQLPATASSPRTTAGRTAGARASTPRSAGTRRCPAAATAPSRSARSSSRSGGVRAVPGDQGVPGGVLPRPDDAADQATVAAITASFQSGGYKLKQVFQQSAAACPGQ